jgi:plastocyanin
MNRIVRSPHLLIGIVALALAASACSHAKAQATKHSPAATPTPTSTASGAKARTPVSLPGVVNNHGTMDLSLGGNKPTLKLEADDFYFAPTFVKTKRGATVTVEFKNEGKMPHTFTIAKPHIDVVLQPGQKRTVTVTLPTAAKSLPFYCRFHQGQGMQGAFYQ